MPFLPAHLGPAILIGSLAGRKLNLVVLILANVLIDLEVVFLGLRTGFFAYHGFWHTYGGATLFGLILAISYFLLLFIIRKIKDYSYGGIELYKSLREHESHEWVFSFKCILFSALIGAYSHVSLDWLFYEHIRVTIVSRTNPYLMLNADYLFFEYIIYTTYFFCFACALIGLVVYYFRYKLKLFKVYKVETLFNLKPDFSDLLTLIGLIAFPFAFGGIIVMIIYLTVPFTMIGYGAWSYMNANFSIFLISVIALIVSSFCFRKALRIKGWKLFE